MLAAPAAIVEQLPSLKQIDRVAALPIAIRTGQFTVDGSAATGWRIAEPGGPFNPTDVTVPGMLGRRLIFAACNSKLCLIHYERGGVAHFYEILALSRTPKGWIAIWNAVGPKPLANLPALRNFLRGRSLAPGWSEQTVRGDF